MKVLEKRVVLIVLLCGISLMFGVGVVANSGPSRWERDPGGEILAIVEDTDIEVGSELLEFKVEYNGNPELSKTYVSATYDMVNTSEEATTCQMAFPFVSDYRSFIHRAPAVLVNDEIVDFTIYPGKTLYYPYGHQKKSDDDLYTFESIVGGIHEEYQEINGLSPETPGTLYKLETDDINGDLKVTAVIKKGGQGKVITSGFYHQKEKDGEVYLSGFYGNGNGYYLFVYGGEVDFRITAIDDWESYREIEYDKTLLESEMTYLEFYKQVIEPEIDFHTDSLNRGFSEVGMYNAETIRLFDYEEDGLINMDMTNGYFDSSNDNRLFTLVYEVPFDGGQENRVQVSYNMPASYDTKASDGCELCFEYILNPASYWKEFGQLEVMVEAPSDFVVSDSSMEFQEIEEGLYKAVSETLPEEDLVVKLLGPAYEYKVASEEVIEVHDFDGEEMTEEFVEDNGAMINIVVIIIIVISIGIIGFRFGRIVMKGK